MAKADFTYDISLLCENDVSPQARDEALHRMTRFLLAASRPAALVALNLFGDAHHNQQLELCREMIMHALWRSDDDTARFFAQNYHWACRTRGDLRDPFMGFSIVAIVRGDERDLAFLLNAVGALPLVEGTASLTNTVFVAEMVEETAPMAVKAAIMRSWLDALSAMSGQSRALRQELYLRVRREFIALGDVDTEAACRIMRSLADIGATASTLGIPSGN